MVICGENCENLQRKGTSAPLLQNRCCAQYFRFGDLIQPVEFSQRSENQARQLFSQPKAKRRFRFLVSWIRTDFMHAGKWKVGKSQRQFFFGIFFHAYFCRREIYKSRRNFQKLRAIICANFQNSAE